ncbi:hypothetical protein GCM10027578_32140 [Spirosoma luteolum]
MARAVEMGQREQLIALKKQGCTLAQISQQLALPLPTVRKLSARYKDQGQLLVSYANCGPKQPTSPANYLRAARWLKHLHPQWGAPLIHLKLLDRYGPIDMPSVRTLQRWFVRWQLIQPRQHWPQTRIGQAKAVHNIWQVDAKENLQLVDGQKACYLTIVDEHSGAGLAAPVFPLRAHLPSAPGDGSASPIKGIRAMGQAWRHAGG